MWLLFLGCLLFTLVAGLFWMTRMPGLSHGAPLAPLSQQEIELQAQLEKHVGTLAGQIGERNLFRYAALEEAASYIAQTWRDLGYEVSSQDITVSGKTVKNLEVELVGHSLPHEVLVIGAHYDSVIHCPGANDNASGTAAVLELARLLQGKKFARTLRLVAFVNEEPPFFQTEYMGSYAYARRARQRREKIAVMLSVETIGCYADSPRSQQYPFPFSLLYPSTGNFIGFVGNLASRDLVRRVIDSFRRHAAFPSQGVAAPGWITGVGWSDQWSFWREGYPGVMVTDTAPFRYVHYHTALDTPDKVDYERTARVVAGLAKVIADLAGE